MILPKIDEVRFLEIVHRSPLIAFQAVRYGFAVAADGEACYAPLQHPGGGNLPAETFIDKLGYAFIDRMSTPALRTLRPTAKPASPPFELLEYLKSFDGGHLPSFEDAFSKCAGDHSAVVEYQCQVVIQAIEEFERPELRDAMLPAKKEVIEQTIEDVIIRAELARDACEAGDWKPLLVRHHLLQCSSALQHGLKMFLLP